MDLVPIDEGLLGTAKVGTYEVLRDGKPVTKVGDYYRFESDELLRNIPQKLVAFVGDSQPGLYLPAGVERAMNRNDGKMLVEVFLPEREL